VIGREDVQQELVAHADVGGIGGRMLQVGGVLDGQDVS